MEPLLSNINANGGHQTEPTPAHRVSGTSRDNVASPGQKHNDSQAGQLEPRFRNDKANLLQAHGARSLHKSGRNSNATSTANNEREASYTLLTAQTLQEHDLQQASCSQLFSFRDAVPQGHVIGLEAAVAAPLEGPTNYLQTEGTRAFNNIKLYDDPHSRSLMYWDQTQSQQQSIASTYHEADFDTPTYEGAGRWPRPSYREHIVGIAGHDEYDIEPLSWNMDSDGELTAWGNDLAGIGEHLAGSTYNEYASANDFVVD